MSESSEINRVPEGYAYLRRRRVDEEITIIAPPGDVVDIYKSIAAENGHKGDPKIEVKPIEQLPLFAHNESEDGTPPIDEVTDVPSNHNQDGQESGNSHQPLPVNFIEFYENKAPQDQPAQLAVITYFYIRHRSHECVTSSDFESAYRELEELPADNPPGNLHSAVQNALTRSEWLRKVGKGQYALTRKGERFVESLGQGEEE